MLKRGKEVGGSALGFSDMRLASVTKVGWSEVVVSISTYVSMPMYTSSSHMFLGLPGPLVDTIAKP